LTDDRTSAEVDSLISVLQLPPYSRLLDVGCGFGRHSVEFARRGFAVVAIDPSEAMIAAARNRADAVSVEVDFRVQAGESFVTGAKFDAAICLFTTLGQISEGADNLALLDSVYEAVRPGAHFVVEVPQRKTAVARLKSEERLGGDQRYCIVSRIFDASTNTIAEKFAVVTPQHRRSYLLRYRLFDLAELSALVSRAGFTVEQVCADCLGAPLLETSPMMLLIARK
jgi:D-alanine-D-alanine ligase